MEDRRIEKVNILIGQQKYEEAERILKDLLSSDANNIYLLTLFAEVNLQQDKFDVAEKIIQNAITLAPDEAHLFYVKSRVEANQGNLDLAEKSALQAVAFDPYDADYFAMLAHLKLLKKQFKEGLEIANKALEIDAENILAINCRSTALIKLNKSEEAFTTIEGALREDPNNAYTHANYGWGLLENGNPKKALEHFKESLKNDPNSEYAQSGMVEAIKATNPIYKMFLKYSFWMHNLTSKYQWGVIVGFYFGFKFLRVLASNNKALEPFLMPIIILLAVIAFSTWVIQPISNLFLRFNKYGNILLNKDEKLSSNFVAGSLLFSIVGIVFLLILGEEKYLSIVFFGLAMMLPLSVMFSPAKSKNTLVIYTISMAIIGLSAIGIALNNGVLMNGFSLLFMLAFFGFQWFANYLTIEKK